MIVFSVGKNSKKVAYLGPEKTFTEIATKELFPFSELIPIQPIRKVVALCFTHFVFIIAKNIIATKNIPELLPERLKN